MEQDLEEGGENDAQVDKKDTMEIALSIVSGVSGALLCMKVFRLI